MLAAAGLPLGKAQTDPFVRERRELRQPVVLCVCVVVARMSEGSAACVLLPVFRCAASLVGGWAAVLVWFVGIGLVAVVAVLESGSLRQSAAHWLVEFVLLCVCCAVARVSEGLVACVLFLVFRCVVCLAEVRCVVLV